MEQAGWSALQGALVQTYSADAGQRRAAEATLRQLQRAPGFVRQLVALVAAQGVPEHVRLAAAIALKNTVARGWHAPADLLRGAQQAPPPQPAEEAPEVPEADRQWLRQQVVGLLDAARGPVRKQLAVVLQKMAAADYPAAWPELPALLQAGLCAGSVGALLGLRFVLRNVAGAGKSDAHWPALCALVDATFPLLEQAAAVLRTQTPLYRPGAACEPQLYETEALLLRVFRASTTGAIPPHLHSAETLGGWLVFLGAVLGRALQPCGAVPPALWWKGPRRATVQALAMLVRFGKSARRLKEAPLRAALALFTSKHASEYAMAMARVLAQYHALRVPAGTAYAMLLYLGHTARYKQLFAALQPHALALLTQVVFPLCCPPPQTLQLAVASPLEFLQSEFACGDDDDDGDGSGGGDDFMTRMQGARAVLVDFCTRRAEHVLVPCMQFVARVLSDASAANDVARKYAGLAVVAALEGVLKDHEDDAVGRQLVPMVTALVLPDLAHPHPLLRAQACWTFACFSSLDWSGAAPAFAAACRAVLAMARSDANEVVAVHAARALTRVVETDRGRELLRPALGQVLEALYRQVDRTDVELDELVDALSTVAREYGADVAPHAFSMCTHLAASVGRVLTSLAGAGSAGSAGGDADDEADDYDDDDDATEAAVSKANTCLATMEAVLDAVAGPMPELAAQLVEALAPLVGRIVGAGEERWYDFYTDAFSLLRAMTHAVVQPGAALWALVPAMARCFDANPDMLPDMVGALHCLISRDPDTLEAHPELLAVLHRMVAPLLTDATWNEVDCSRACLLATAPTHFCRSGACPAVGAFAADVALLAARRLCHPAGVQSRVLAVLLLDVVLAGLIHHTELVLRALAQQPDALGGALDALHRSRPLFVRAEDQLHAVLGLAALMAQPLNTLPPVVVQRAPALLADALAFMCTHQRCEYHRARADAIDRLKEQAELRGVPWRSLATPQLLAPDPYDNDAWRSDTDTAIIKQACWDEDDDEDEEGDGSSARGEYYDEEGEDDDDDMARLAAEEAEMFDDGDLDDFADIDDEGLMSPFVGVDHVALFGSTMKKLAALASTNTGLAAMIAAMPPKKQHQMQHWIAQADKHKAQR